MFHTLDGWTDAIGKKLAVIARKKCRASLIAHHSEHLSVNWWEHSSGHFSIPVGSQVCPWLYSQVSRRRCVVAWHVDLPVWKAPSNLKRSQSSLGSDFMPYLKYIKCMRKCNMFCSPSTWKANGQCEEDYLNFLTSMWLIWGLWQLQTPERNPSLPPAVSDNSSPRAGI